MSGELKPCPFCGERPSLPSGDGTQYEIECECGMARAGVQICDLMSIEERTEDSFTDHRYAERFIERAKQEAIEQWNTRAQAAPEAEPVAWKMFDGEGGYDYTDDKETAEDWRKSLGDRYKSWLEPLYAAPQHEADLIELLTRASGILSSQGFSAWDELAGRIDAKLKALGANP